MSLCNTEKTQGREGGGDFKLYKIVDSLFTAAALQLSDTAAASADEMLAAAAAVGQRCEQNLACYDELTGRLCGLVEAADLHWRHYNTCLSMLCTLLRLGSTLSSLVW